MFDDGSDLCVWPSALMLNVVALPASALSSSSELWLSVGIITILEAVT